jgi:hypothetical protein
VHRNTIITRAEDDASGRERFSVSDEPYINHGQYSKQSVCGFSSDYTRISTSADIKETHTKPPSSKIQPSEAVAGGASAGTLACIRHNQYLRVQALLKQCMHNESSVQIVFTDYYVQHFF